VAEKEMYRLDVVVNVIGENTTKSKLSAIDKFTETTKKNLGALNRIKASPTATIQDRITAPLRTIEGRMKALNKVVAVAVRVKDEASGVLGNIAKKIKSLPTAIMIGVGAAATGTGVFVYKSLNKAVDFEAQMSSIEALTDLTGQEMLEMQALAMEMGAKTQYSALEAAKGMEELLKAGISPAQVKAGALEAALNLATAGSLELAKAAEIMSTSLNAFKRDGITAAQASDILAGTANASATSVEELAYGLAQTSAVASGLGMSLKDTNIALGIFANNGLRGSDAGTSFKTFLSNLIPVTDKQIKLFDKLGLTTAGVGNQFFTAEGNIKSFEEIADVMQKTFANMTAMERQFALEQIFGSDALRAGTIIALEGAAGVKKFNDEMSRVTALEVARKKMNNAAGAAEEFQGALETLQISAMLPFLPTIKRMAEGAASFTEKYSPAIIASMESAAKKVEEFFNRLSQDEKFQNLSWGEKVSYALNEVSAEFKGWMDGPGGEVAKEIGRKTGELIGVGLEGATPALVVIGGSVGKAIGQGVVSAFGEALKSSPLGAIILGAIPGAMVGSVVPGVGTAIGGAAGGAAGLITWIVSKITGIFGPKKAEASESSSSPTTLTDTSTTDIKQYEQYYRQFEEFYNTQTTTQQSYVPATQPQPSESAVYANEDMVNSTILASDAMLTSSAIITAFNTNLQGKATEIIARMGAWSEQAWTITGIATAFSANLQNMANEVISRGLSFAGALSDAANRAGSFVMPSFGASRATPVEPHAAGGIFSSPHLGVVAEAGPEAIIPLSSKMRDRGIELWKQAGRFLGIAPHAEGGIFGSSKLVTEAGPEAGIPFSRSPERIRERGLGLWQQINNVFSPAMPALALAGSGAETGLLYDGIDYGPELSGQVQELNVPISIANITANISGSSLDVEDIAEQVGEQVKQQVKWEITRELANAIENRI